MQEVELTFRRLLSIWWLFMWRGMVIGALIGFAVGLVFNTAAYLVTRSVPNPRLGLGIGMIIGTIWGVIVMGMALRKRYRDFRIALVEMPPKEKTGEPPQR